jgi:RNA polymerase sigma-70 factor (ECF subfamily)
MSAIPVSIVEFAGQSSALLESDLVVQAAQGDAEAFGALYARHRRRLYRYICARLGDERDSEDLVEAVFLQAWETLPTYRLGEFPFVAWLYRVARNLLDQHQRDRIAHQPVQQESAREPVEDTCPWPEEALLSREKSEWVRAALSRLRPEHQQILVLRFLSGLSHSEAAEVLGVTAGNVRVLQHRALKALTAGLRGEQAGCDGSDD